MDRREACGQPDEQYETLYRGAPVYDTLEPGQASSNPIYERFVCTVVWPLLMSNKVAHVTRSSSDRVTTEPLYRKS